MNNSLSRRNFLKTAAFATTAALAAPAIVPSSVFGAAAPSNRITMALIGAGGRGTNAVTKGLTNKPDVQVVAVCDVDTGHRKKACDLAGLDSKAGYNDFRDVLARGDIDTVLIATPDHWHVPISIAAARAGKDIYCEKPLTLTIAEGRTLCDAVKRYGTIFQTGSQQRSGREFRFGCELVRNGRIGRLHTIRLHIPPNNRFCSSWQPEPIPQGFDYDLWLGPAPWQPYNIHRCHYEFRFILDYSGGQMTNFGAHYLDIAQWANDADDTGPVEIEGHGEFLKDGLFNTANKVNVKYTYANGVEMFCTTGGTGIRFEGTEGWVFVDRGIIDAKPKSLLTSKTAPNEIHLYKSKGHLQNFIDCVKLRKDTVATAEIGHRSTTVCHLGNIAMILGRKLNWDPAKERFVNDPQANRMLSRPMRSPWQV